MLAITRHSTCTSRAPEIGTRVSSVTVSDRVDLPVAACAYTFIFCILMPPYTSRCIAEHVYDEHSKECAHPTGQPANRTAADWQVSALAEYLCAIQLHISKLPSLCSITYKSRVYRAYNSQLNPCTTFQRSSMRVKKAVCFLFLRA